MTRILKIAAAQSGPIARTESRAEVVDRLILQLRAAERQECDLVGFTECALTAFFPHWWIESEEERETACKSRVVCLHRYMELIPLLQASKLGSREEGEEC